VLCVKEERKKRITSPPKHSNVDSLATKLHPYNSTQLLLFDPRKHITATSFHGGFYRVDWECFLQGKQQASITSPPQKNSKLNAQEESVAE